MIHSRKRVQRRKLRTKQVPTNQVTSAIPLWRRSTSRWQKIWKHCFFGWLFFLKPFVLTHRTAQSHKKEDKHVEKDKDLSKKQENKSGKSESLSPPGANSPMKDDRKHGRRFNSFLSPLDCPVELINIHLPFLSVFVFLSVGAKSPGQMVGQSNMKKDSFFKQRPFRRGRYFDKVRIYIIFYYFKRTW